MSRGEAADGGRAYTSDSTLSFEMFVVLGELSSLREVFEMISREFDEGNVSCCCRILASASCEVQGGSCTPTPN